MMLRTLLLTLVIFWSLPVIAIEQVYPPATHATLVTSAALEAQFADFANNLATLQADLEWHGQEIERNLQLIVEQRRRNAAVLATIANARG